MKQKFYSMYGTAVDRFGEEHIVTIVGEYTQEKVETEVTKEVDMEDDFKPTRMVKAKITYPTKIKIRTLTYAVSICHPDDEYIRSRRRFLCDLAYLESTEGNYRNRQRYIHAVLCAGNCRRKILREKP